MCDSSDEESCISTSDYFLSAVKKLCLNDFPHGFGKWRLSSMDFSVDVRQAIHKTMKFYEEVDDLIDLVKDAHSPWKCSNQWSDDICSLKEIAVRHPEVLWKKNFLWKHFRSLKFIDKNISEVDADVAKLINLKSLILSVNKIQYLNVNHIPACLQHFVLFGNQILVIIESETSPPNIIMHLGLGQNCLNNLENCFAPTVWPCLTSLDLCLNNLDDLPRLCCRLMMLSNLRSLFTFGNPLSFVPLYRAYIIDSIKQLTHLDGIRINAMERKYARGLKDRDCRDAELQEGKILVQVLQINGLPSPEGSESSGRRCFVRYSFISHCIPTHKMSTFTHPNEENPESNKTVDFNEDEFHVTKSYEWKENIEVCESVVVRFQNLSELKNRLFGNLLVEVVEEKTVDSSILKSSVPDETSKTNKKKTPQKKSMSKSSAESKSTIDSKENDIVVKPQRSHLQIFSLPLSGLLGKCSQLDLKLKKKLLFEVQAPRASFSQANNLNKTKVNKNPEKQKMEQQERHSDSDQRRVVSGVLELNIKVVVVRAY